MALLEKDAIDLLQKSAAYIVKSAYQEANQVAYNAATQSSYSSSSNTTTSKADVNIQNNSSSKASAAGAAVVGTATVVAATAATTKTDSQTSGTINQRHTSTSSTTTTTTDGYLRYQVYQQEKTKADSVAKKIENAVAEAADTGIYSQFTINKNGKITKEILAYSKKKIDLIRVSFDLNGVTYVTEWTPNEVDRRY